MTVLEMNPEKGSFIGGPPIKLAVDIKIGHEEERAFEIEIGQPIGSVLVVIAAEWGCAVEEVILLRDGESSPIPGGTVVDHDYPRHHRHHAHHVHDLDVVVFYQADTHHQSFKRFQTVEAVLDWAIPKFGIDPTMAPEFEVARHNVKEELPMSEHLGHLAGHRRCLELDLIRSEMPNG